MPEQEVYGSLCRTLQKYGLKIDTFSDERIDPQKATYAAAEYLKDLIGIFGANSSIMLVMAAYNAGEKRIMDALRKIDDPIRNRDFWYIYQMGFLSEENNEYIPMILALLIIDNNREYFGFSNRNIVNARIEETEDDYCDR
jgi:membrane-bound lytic murein transglycosylase D